MRPLLDTARLLGGKRPCSAQRRCRRRSCSHCGPIRAGDEFRKFRDNLVAYGGRIMLVAVTGPGADVLPWDGRAVERSAAFAWNMTASKRFARLMKAAQQVADRQTRKAGWRGPMPRVVARAWAPQKRGVWHVHLALPAESEIERAWSRTAVRFIDAAQRGERAVPGRERRVLIELEHELGVVVRGFYGWGFIDRNPSRELAGVRGELGASRAARYLAENVARYLRDNATESESTDEVLPGRTVRSHVSVRLTTATGVTIRNLRRARYLHVCMTRALPLPAWPEDVHTTVKRVLDAGVRATRAP